MGSGGEGQAAGGSLAVKRAATTSAATVTAAAAVKHARELANGGGEREVLVDFVYGLHPDSSTGGCVVQRAFEQDLRHAAGVSAVNVHVASDLESADDVFRLLRQQQQQQQDGEGAGSRNEPRSRVVIIDGIALLLMRKRLHELKNLPVAEGGGGGGGGDTGRCPRVLAAVVHCPFSEPFYREEPWLRAALPEHMLLDEDGAGIHAEETRLFGLFDRIIAVGAPCRRLLTASYGVPESAIVVLEPTFETPAPATDGLAAAAAVAAAANEACIAPATSAAAGNVSAGSSLRFVSVGTLCPRKGQLALVAAMRAACAAHPAELGGSVLTLIGGEGGDPAYAEAVRAAISGSGAHNRGGRLLEVRLLGSLPHAETLEALGASDAFLLNSCLESWAIAPVEAALRGVPVITTRVGWLSQSLPQNSTIWVGAGQAGQGHGVACGIAGGSDRGLASSADWEQALLQFARSRDRRRADAMQAVPYLQERFGQAVVSSSRARAVRDLLKVTREGGKHPLRDSSSSTNLFDNGGASAVSADQERVRRATVSNALACVLATCVAISGTGGATGGLVALVSAQLLLLFNLAPPCSPANVVTMSRSFIPPAVLWLKAGSDFGQVAMNDVAVFGVLFVALDILDGILARRSKMGPTRVGAALDVESDSIAVLFLSLAASRKAWVGGFIAGALRYLFVLATGARELPPSPIGPAGRWIAKIAALVSVAALAASVGNGTTINDGGGGGGVGGDESDNAAAMTATAALGGSEWPWDWMSRRAVEGSSPFLCASGVAVLLASFSIDFFQIWVLLPREAAAAARAKEEEAVAAVEAR